jgi:phenazine biosynthesis protein phzE
MFKDIPQIREALRSRNNTLAKFWFSDPCSHIVSYRVFNNKKVLMVDAEDTFTFMLAQLLSEIGLKVTLRNHYENNLLNGAWDIIILGPGHGDPRNINIHRITRMREAITSLYTQKAPFFAICLSHQLLCLTLGFKIVQLSKPNQGIQCEINLFGKRELVGFYNTFVAKNEDAMVSKMRQLSIEISHDPLTQVIHALKGAHFISLQFHPESILTQHGTDIISNSIRRIIK